MPRFFAIAFLLILSPLGAEEWKPVGEEVIPLNGTWKFHALDLAGSNYRAIKRQEGDLVIDNADPEHVTIAGKWGTRTEDKHGVPFEGGNFLKRWYTEGDPDTYVRFAAAVPQDGYYEHYIRHPYGAMLHTRHDIRHAGGLSTVDLSERLRCGHWIYLGTYEVKKGESSITVTANGPGDVVVDAVLFRPVAAERVARAREERTKVFHPDYDDSGWQDLKVPGHWGMLNDYANYTGRAWYRRKFSLPAGWTPESNERLRLKFDGVYHLSRVYLNGEFLGENRGGFTPFAFDITDRVKAGGVNHLAVEVDNNFMVGATWNWGGIIREVSLVKSHEVRVAYQYLHADPDLESGEAELKIKLRIANDSARARDLKVVSRILDEGPLAAVEEVMRVRAGSVHEFTTGTTLPAEDVRLWHFDSPNLYFVETVIEEGGTPVHSRRDRFGIRKVEITATGMLLNGEPVRLSGYNRVSDHRYWGSSEPQEIVDRDVDLMKEANANFMRIMHGNQNKRLLDRCDEKGIMIFEEVNVRELGNPEFTPPDYPLVKAWLKGMIERDCNHACIVGWSVGNELKHHLEYVRTTIDYVRSELDPHRLVTCVSNTGAREDATPETDPIGFGELVLQNVYEQTPARAIDEIRGKWPKLPIFFSEFGTGKFATPSLDHEISGLAEWNACIRGQRTFVIGASPWTYNDYRSCYVGTLEDENRSWGLVDVWRQKRRAFAQAQREYSPVKALEIEAPDPARGSAAVKLVVRGRDDFPSYTLRDYTLAWTFRNGAGELLKEGWEELPGISPEDGQWTGTVSWGALAGDATDLLLEVMTPNGYVRYSERVSFSVPETPAITGAIGGDGVARVFFEKPYGAEECYARVRNAAGKVSMSANTIDRFVEVTGLTNGTEYQVEVIACNEAGESEPSAAEEVTCHGQILPPLIKHASMKDGMLVLGYTGEAGDERYTVEYGSSASSLDESFTSPNRGMLVLPLGGRERCFARLKRFGAGGESPWSPVAEAEK